MEQKTKIMTEHSAMPLLCLTLGWCLGCFFLPMLEVWHYGLCLILASGGFFVGLKFFPSVKIEVEIPLTESEKLIHEQRTNGWLCVQQLEEITKQVRTKSTQKLLEDIGLVSNQIMQEFEKNSSLQEGTRRMIEYYLPMLIKLVKRYAELEELTISSLNIEDSKAEIEQTIQLCAQAFHEQWDDLHETEAMTIDADTDVLEALLARQGLLEKSFKEEPK